MAQAILNRAVSGDWTKVLFGPNSSGKTQASAIGSKAEISDRWTFGTLIAGRPVGISPTILMPVSASPNTLITAMATTTTNNVVGRTWKNASERREKSDCCEADNERKNVGLVERQYDMAKALEHVAADALNTEQFG